MLTVQVDRLKKVQVGLNLPEEKEKQQTHITTGEMLIFHNVTFRVTLTLSGPMFWRAWFGRGGAQSPPPRKSLKEMSETPYLYLEVRPLSKLGTHEKFQVEISKNG